MPENKSSAEQDKTLITWLTKSHTVKPEDMQMRPVLTVMVALVALIMVFAGEWMLLLVLIAGGFYYYAMRKSEPLEIEFSITTKGIRAFGRMFMWWEFNRWWWEDKITSKILVVELSAGMMARIYMPTGNASPAEIEKIMNKYLLMEKPKETLVDKMVAFVKEKFPLENKI